MFDVNPHPDPQQARSTSIMGADSLPEEVEALHALAEECSLSPAQARERIARVAGAIAGWRDAARRNGVREQEITMMAESIAPRLDAVIATSGRA